MALPNTGALSLSQIQTEFGGVNPIGINEYYGAASGIPSSGTIDIADFYGKVSTPPAAQTFNSSGTWNRPAKPFNYAYVRVWAAGGGGGTGSSSKPGGGGGGGGFVRFYMNSGDMPNSYSIVVGNGGNPTSSTGNTGGYSSAFGARVNGGVGGLADRNPAPGGAGGTISSWPSYPYNTNYYEAGGVGGQGYKYGGSPGQNRSYSGGGGGGSAESGGRLGGAGGVSTYGGNGGKGSNGNTYNSVAGSIPGGGGGGGDFGAKAGARGMVNITYYK